MSQRSRALDAAFQQAARLHAAGRLAEAEAFYRRILAAAPSHGDARHGLGVLALQTGHPEDALAHIDAALARDPRAALFHANRANALLALGRAPDAEAACREAIRLKRNAAEAWASLGHALSDLGRPEEAIEAYRTALQHNPRLPELHTGIGLALHDAARLEEAEAALEEAARRAPGDPVAALNLASLRKDRGKLVEAEADYRALIARDPADAAAHHNLGVLLLLAGRHAEGWPEWDWRFRAEPHTDRRLPAGEWRGEALAGRSLFVHAEQGIGDLIHFARFLPMLPRDGRVLVETPPALRRLFAQLPGITELVPLGTRPPPHDLKVAFMSLPGRLPIAATADRAAPVPYFTPERDAVAAWRARLAALPGRRVGLVFAGNPGLVRMDRRRSIPPALLAPLDAVADVTFVSLQKPAPATPPPLRRWVDPTADLGDFADTAALIAALDLVIGVDTAVVHLAGALGAPVWLLNRADTDWRWGVGRDDTPWYPTLRQFRQPRPGDWPSVIAAVAAALAA
ncbi:MAG: glycosyltransferase family protein [Rhodospirillales bacterium]|nr:glycosyltransferase family protein [Rhodospirillales bacterium]